MTLTKPHKAELRHLRAYVGLFGKLLTAPSWAAAGGLCERQNSGKPPSPVSEMEWLFQKVPMGPQPSRLAV